MALFQTRNFNNINFPRLQSKPPGEIWTLSINGTTHLLSLEDTVKAISKLAKLT